MLRKRIILIRLTVSGMYASAVENLPVQINLTIEYIYIPNQIRV